MTATVPESAPPGPLPRRTAASVRPFGPGDLLWRYVGEYRALLTFPSATLMQAMHPQIGAAVGAYSVVLTDPWGRAQRSLDSVATWVYGGEQAVAEGRRLREMHKRFSGIDERGRRYHALSGEPYAWVALSAFERLVTTQRLFGRPFSRREEKQLYDEVLRLCRILQVPEHELPPTVGDYWAYFDDMVATTLENHPTVHAVLESSKTPAPPAHLPRLLGPAWKPLAAVGGGLGHFLTVGTFPPECREILGLEWTRRDERRLRAVAAAIRVNFPLLPERLRYLPKPYHARRTGEWTFGLPAAHNSPY